MEFVKIHDPDKPGDYLVLAKQDFDALKHRLFESEPPAVSASEPEPEKTKSKRKG